MEFQVLFFPHSLSLPSLKSVLKDGTLFKYCLTSCCGIRSVWILFTFWPFCMFVFSFFDVGVFKRWFRFSIHFILFSFFYVSIPLLYERFSVLFLVSFRHESKFSDPFHLWFLQVCFMYVCVVFHVCLMYVYFMYALCLFYECMFYVRLCMFSVYMKTYLYAFIISSVLNIGAKDSIILYRVAFCHEGKLYLDNYSLGFCDVGWTILIYVTPPDHLFL